MVNPKVEIQAIDYIEFQGLLGKMLLEGASKHNDVANTFRGTLFGVPIIIYFDFLTLTGHVQRLTGQES